jgi:hypothetical protein
VNLIADVINQSLDACGSMVTIGDPEEGTREAQVALRAYGQCLRQMLRAANWDFARKQAPLTLLADATGQTSGVGSVVPVPWIYEYQYPVDCMKVRFVPWNYLQAAPVPAGNIQIPTTIPLTTAGNGQAPLSGQRLKPARFLVANDPNYAPQQGQIFWETQGQSPQGNTVILTDVQNAQVVYTALMLYPSVWDPLFREGLVAYLASQLALPLAKDKKFGLQMRKENIEIAKMKIQQARIADGNEGHYSSDIKVDWMAFRNAGRGGPFNNGGGFGGGGPGVYWGGWDNVGFSDGSAY